MKLFTKAIDDQLFAQYKFGSDLSKQKVVAKIFNPYGRGTWYLLNSDPEDPDYIWAIVNLFDVEIGSVSRSELESVRVPPFRLPLERDRSFTPIAADGLYNGLMAGKHYEKGGRTDDDDDDDEEGENADMLRNQVKSITHHVRELTDIIDNVDKVEPWVITKAQRAATDLADITHYLDGEKSYAMGGQLELPFPPDRNDLDAFYEVTGSKPLSEYVFDDPVVSILENGVEEFGVRYTSAADAWAYIRSFMRADWDDPLRFAISVPGEVLKVVQKAGMTRPMMADGGMMAMGGIMYPDLSTIPATVVNEPTKSEKKKGVLDKNVPEINITLKETGLLPGTIVRQSGDAVRAFLQIWKREDLNVRERMYVIYLNRANRIIGYTEHSIGGITGVILDVEIVAATAAKALAKGVIIAHNHPSGNLESSSADKQISIKLKKALELLDINLLDSIIITPQSTPSSAYTSLTEIGELARGGMLAQGGKTDFNTLAMKIAAGYEGKAVKPEYQEKYGKRYSKEEAMQVGRATAAVIERRKGMM